MLTFGVLNAAAGTARKFINLNFRGLFLKLFYIFLLQMSLLCTVSFISFPLVFFKPFFGVSFVDRKRNAAITAAAALATGSK